MAIGNMCTHILFDFQFQFSAPNIFMLLSICCATFAYHDDMIERRTPFRYPKIYTNVHYFPLKVDYSTVHRQRRTKVNVLMAECMECLQPRQQRMLCDDYKISVTFTVILLTINAVTRWLYVHKLTNAFFRQSNVSSYRYYNKSTQTFPSFIFISIIAG